MLPLRDTWHSDMHLLPRISEAREEGNVGLITERPEKVGTLPRRGKMGHRFYAGRQLWSLTRFSTQIQLPHNTSTFCLYAKFLQGDTVSQQRGDASDGLAEAWKGAALT